MSLYGLFAYRGSPDLEKFTDIYHFATNEAIPNIISITNINGSTRAAIILKVFATDVTTTLVSLEELLSFNSFFKSSELLVAFNSFCVFFRLDFGSSEFSETIPFSFFYNGLNYLDS